MSEETQKIRIVFDEAKCIGSAACFKANPNVFGFDEKRQTAILLNGKKANERVFETIISGDAQRIKSATDAAASCPVNAFVVTSLDSGKTIVSDTINGNSAPTLHAVYDDQKDFILDDKGYFLIRVNYNMKEIEVGFCNEKNNVVVKVVGKMPIGIYHTIATKTNLELRKEHYAYLGRELEKAYHCLMTNLEYVQDDELHEMKKRKV
jgi:ferredoxin